MGKRLPERKHMAEVLRNEVVNLKDFAQSQEGIQNREKLHAGKDMNDVLTDLLGGGDPAEHDEYAEEKSGPENEKEDGIFETAEDEAKEDIPVLDPAPVRAEQKAQEENIPQMKPSPAAEHALYTGESDSSAESVLMVYLLAEERSGRICLNEGGVSGFDFTFPIGSGQTESKGIEINCKAVKASVKREGQSLKLTGSVFDIPIALKMTPLPESGMRYDVESGGNSFSFCEDTRGTLSGLDMNFTENCAVLSSK